MCAHYDLPVRIVHLNSQEMYYNEDDTISNKTTTKGYDSDELVSKKRAHILQCDSEDNDETDEAPSDVECQLVTSF